MTSHGMNNFPKIDFLNIKDEKSYSRAQKL